MAQGVLGFQYEEEPQTSGLTAFAGLFLYLDLFTACGLRSMVDKHLGFLDGAQGWTAYELLTSLALLNIAGGDGVNDIEQLEQDGGFSEVVRHFAVQSLNRRQRRELEARRRKGRQRALPSRSAIFRFLNAFHDEEQEKQRVEGKAFIPKPNRALKGMYHPVESLVAFVQRCQPQRRATLDMDATLDPTHKREALYSYKGFKAFQPLNVWWAEQQLIVRSEFRDGNVPAGYQQLRVLKDALQGLPAGVREVRIRTDTAGYEIELLRYCAEGKDPRFGIIAFASGVDVTESFKNAVHEVPESDWHPLPSADGRDTAQQWADICFVPNWVGHSKKGPTYRFLAIREPLAQRSLPGIDVQQTLPFPTTELNNATYKLFGVVTNRLDIPGDELIHWHRQRCGKSEEVHAVMKDDLAGGRLPSGKFGANAAWWGIMIVALNLQAAFKQLALGGVWINKRLKAIRFALIHIAGRVIHHARRLVVRLNAGHPNFQLILQARQRLLALSCGPSG